MNNKTKTRSLRVAIIAIALLLCLALTIGITSAWHQAKRQATGTLSMDQGIIIDYTGFDKTGDDWAIWGKEAKLPLFETTNAQPGQNIPVNAAGIRANEKSVNFYARVKLSYKFYNGETLLYDSNATTGNVEGFKPSDLITTSANFFGTNWVDGGGADGYYYYATGTTLNKFEKGTQTFVDLFATDAKFVIEGEGFKGSNDLEGGGFVVDETTSINKIEVYLTLETLQGDATAEQAKALGWKISQKVDFSKVDEGKIVTSVNGDPVDEKLNVTINGNQTKLEEVKFPYGEETVLEFDSKNVEYVELKYSDNTTEKFYELEASENSATKNSQIQVLADESHGTVKGYIVGTFSSSEYKGLTFSEQLFIGDYREEFDLSGGIAVAGYFGDGGNVVIPNEQKVRRRSFKTEITDYSGIDSFFGKFCSIVNSIIYPVKIEDKQFNSYDEVMAWLEGYTSEQFMQEYPETVTLTFDTLCETKSVLYKEKQVTAYGDSVFTENSSITSLAIGNNIKCIFGYSFIRCSALKSITLPEGKLVSIGDFAFQQCTSLENIIIPDSVIELGSCVFSRCSGLKTVVVGAGINLIDSSVFEDCTSLATKLSDLPGTWVKEDGSTIENYDSILLKDINFNIKKQA